MSGRDWIRGLNRIVSRPDLPLTLQGGEPSLHPDFVYIINNIKPELKIDILTNLQFDVEEFAMQVKPERLGRDAPYALIRVSFHPEVMELDEIISKTKKLLRFGFKVGIWGVLHPNYEKAIYEAKVRSEREGIDFRTKEFLGSFQGKLYGSYKYEGAFDIHNKKEVLCKTTELIIGPDGSIFRCHSGCYNNRNSIGSILDEGFQIEDKFRGCGYFGDCNPCDIKIKTNRFQQYGHTSVEMKFAETGESSI